MPVTGRKPKEGPKRNRNAPTYDWVEVEDAPFAGRVPVRLPARRLLGDDMVPLLSMTKAWWDAVRRMPHCSMWALSDWHFALTTALVADLAFRGSAPAASELRQREKILGTTLDARRDLRIRYVEKQAATAPAVSASVTNLTDRRDRLSSAS